MLTTRPVNRMTFSFSQTNPVSNVRPGGPSVGAAGASADNVEKQSGHEGDGARAQQGSVHG